ncbi:MAG: hypothetical protein VKJ06_08565 [Vampirovibrionales bacterium]|nr:hypothetical protein [Vampirovibrionales bacterium]
MRLVSSLPQNPWFGAHHGLKLETDAHQLKPQLEAIRKILGSEHYLLTKPTWLPGRTQGEGGIQIFATSPKALYTAMKLLTRHFNFSPADQKAQYGGKLFYVRLVDQSQQ